MESCFSGVMRVESNLYWEKFMGGEEVEIMSEDNFLKKFDCERNERFNLELRENFFLR